MPRLSWRPPQRSTIICSESAPLKIWWRNTRWRWKVSLSCVNKILNLLGSVFTYSIISTYFSMKSGGIFWIYSCKCIQNQNCSYRVDFITRVLLPCSDASTCGVVLYILLCVGVVIFKKFDEGRAELTEGLSVKSIVKFVESKAVPLLTEFSQEVSSPSPPLRPALSPSLLRLVLSPPPLSFPHPSLSLLHSLYLFLSWYFRIAIILLLEVHPSFQLSCNELRFRPVWSFPADNGWESVISFSGDTHFQYLFAI